MPTDSPKPTRRGRPPSGQAQTSTERNRARRQRLAGAGAETVTANVGPAGLAKLAQLRAAGLTVDEAVTWALERAPLPTA